MRIAHYTTFGLFISFVAHAAECPVSLANDATTDKARFDNADARLSFELDVLPVLTAAGCNSGACHGKQRGQNGFQLSLLGFDADSDYEALVHQSRGRRLSPAAPDGSLLLRKASARIPHGGGRRLEMDGPHYDLVRRWITQGMPRRRENDPTLAGVSVAPSERVLGQGDKQPLSVSARYSDGSTRDVTALTTFQSDEPAIVSVDENGLVRGSDLAGEATIMARYMGQIVTWKTAIPYAGTAGPLGAAPRWNFIDGLVWDKLEQLNLSPSPPADDRTFMRRAHLDIIGRLPTPDEVRAYLADEDPHKRARLVNCLLERPEYADYWANKWADLLRPNPFRVGIKATFNLDAWLRDAFRRNLTYDELVRGLVTAEGSTWRNGAATLFRDRRQPEEIATVVSQLFLGIRLECARCHHHPFEVWGQDDFFQFAAYFARVGRKGGGLSPPISGSEEIIFTADSGSVKHPLTGKPVDPKPLVGDAREIRSDDDPRAVLVDWMVDGDVDRENDYFAKTGANRIWAEMMGLGLVEPVDDLRATNPPSNPQLLSALGEEFRHVGFDQKELIRTITSSYVYQLSSLPNESNAADTRNYSRRYRRPLRAEVLLDTLCDVTGTSESFIGKNHIIVPEGSRAMELWTYRTRSPILDTFGRPDPNQDPPCERIGDPTVVQALHLMNAEHLHDKVTSDTGRAAELAASERSVSGIVEELYLATYSRYPTEQERAAVEPLFGDSPKERRRATEDLLWTLVNTPEFLLNH